MITFANRMGLGARSWKKQGLYKLLMVMIMMLSTTIIEVSSILLHFHSGMRTFWVDLIANPRGSQREDGNGYNTGFYKPLEAPLVEAGERNHRVATL